MGEFVEKYLDPSAPLKILDVGSHAVWCRGCHKTYRYHFDGNKNWQYVGLDIVEGENVDIVIEDPESYDWGINEEYDVVISGQALEHVKNTHKFMEAINRATKPGGTICIIAPWRWGEHGHPVDCWRIMPDGMTFLLEEICNFEVLDVFKRKNDCVGIAKKN